MAMEFGFVVPQGADWATLKAYAETAERVGIDHLWLSDHMITVPQTDAYHEGWTVASMLAAVTERLRIGHQVLCQSYRNPAFLAKMASTLDVLSGGRFIFGLGAGWFSMEYEMYGYEFPSMGRRLKELREALEICRRLWTEDAPSFEGKFYRIEDAALFPKPVQQPHPPIMIGGGGEKVLLRIVAEYADIWNNAGREINNLAHKIDVLKGHCDAVGRDFNEIVVSQQAPILLANDEADARRRIDAEKEVVWMEDPEESYIWGHPQKVIDTIGAMRDLGVSHFTLFSRPHEEHTAASLERFAADVLPAFR